MSKLEYIEITVKVPKLVVKFLEAQKQDVKEYIEWTVVDSVRADIDAEAFSDPKNVMKNFGLDKVLKAIGMNR